MSSQSIKNYVTRPGYEEYFLKLKDKPDRVAVEIKGEKPMNLERIVVEKVGKNIRVTLFHVMK